MKTSICRRNFSFSNIFIYVKCEENLSFWRYRFLICDEIHVDKMGQKIKTKLFYVSQQFVFARFLLDITLEVTIKV